MLNIKTKTLTLNYPYISIWKINNKFIDRYYLCFTTVQQEESLEADSVCTAVLVISLGVKKEELGFNFCAPAWSQDHGCTLHIY